MNTVLAKTKSIFGSKLFWLGAAEIIGGVAIVAGEQVQASLETGEPIGWGLIAKGALTIVLRYFTRQPVTVSGTPAKEVPAPTPAETAEARSK